MPHSQESKEGEEDAKEVPEDVWTLRLWKMELVEAMAECAMLSAGAYEVRQGAGRLAYNPRSHRMGSGRVKLKG